LMRGLCVRVHGFSYNEHPTLTASCHLPGATGDPAQGSGQGARRELTFRTERGAVYFFSVFTCRVRRASDAMDVFCLYIRVKIKADMVDEFKQRFGVLAKHVREHEPLTLSCASHPSQRHFKNRTRETFSFSLDKASRTPTASSLTSSTSSHVGYTLT
jgi:hypothetical protein